MTSTTSMWKSGKASHNGPIQRRAASAISPVATSGSASRSRSLTSATSRWTSARLSSTALSEPGFRPCGCSTRRRSVAGGWDRRREAVDARPVRGAEVLDHQSAVLAAADPGMTARQLLVSAQAPRALLGPAENELAVERDLLAALRTRYDPQPLSSHGAP